jgi:hypothetical protein
MSEIYRYRSLFALVTMALLITEPLVADPPSRNAASAKAKNESVSGAMAGEINLAVDSSLSATISAGISFGDARRHAVDNGLIGYKPLPPGIRKNLERGKPMPPGIAKTHMPSSFINELPHHEGYEWRRAGSDLLLVAIGSLIIVDLLEHVFD